VRVMFVRFWCGRWDLKMFFGRDKVEEGMDPFKDRCIFAAISRYLVFETGHLRHCDCQNKEVCNLHGTLKLSR